MSEPKPLWLRLAPAIFLLLWSGGFSFAKFGLENAEPITFLALRYALVLAVLLPVALVLRPPLPKRRIDWGHLAVVGFLIQAVYFGLSYYAFYLGISAGGVALIVALQPILVALAVPWSAGEKVPPLRWLGLLCGLAGAGLVIASRYAVEVTSLIGVLAAVGALFGITVATLYEKRFGLSHHPVTSNAVQYAVGLAAVLPLAFFTETMAVEWTLQLGAALAYLVIGNSLISVTLLLAMVRHGEASRVSALFFLVPPMAALIAWGLIGEVLPPLAWAGMALAACGVALVGRPGPRARRV
ncbi:MAG: DMT family transporter [Tistlia sp.]|uniref:DMT family transporter n=1 Tax=Tistlia sp. TaxID=3057121 RepID=UPI0034A5AEEB